MHDLTPMMRQYHQLKARLPGTLLLFRLGDFYELFYDDAKTAARELEIVLTSREVGKGRRIPMCGVPYHAAMGYVARLVERGYRVALCDQVEDPRRAKGLVRREVTRIITPGTVMDESLLPPRASIYLAALAGHGERWGLAAADLSTGEFLVTEVPSAQWPRLREEIARLEPREILVSAGAAEALRTTLAPAHLTPLEEWRWDPATAGRILQEHFRVHSLEGFGCATLPAATTAAGVLLHYLQQTQLSPLEHLRGLRTYTLDDYLVLDEGTRRHLEILRNQRDGGVRHTLLEVLDRTVTTMGGRLLRSWLTQPLREEAAIGARLDAVQELLQQPALRSAVRDALKAIADLPRLVGRIGHGSAGPRDLVTLRLSLERLPALRATLAEATAPRLRHLAGEVEDHAAAAALVARAIVDDPPASRQGGVIRDGYDADLDSLRRAAREGKRWIADLEAVERARTGIKSLRVGYNKVFGYYIEVSKPNLRLVPPDYVRKQTLTAAERFITAEMKEREAQILGAEGRMAEVEARLVAEVRQEVAAHAPAIQRTAAALAEWDVLAALAEVAAVRGYTRPVLTTAPVLRVRAGRHPVVEAALPAGAFVPNDLEMDVDQRAILIVTGPNMAGKSVYCRQAALLTIMAQIGSFVPAEEAVVGITDRIFTRVGATDDTALGRSTFLVEMQETAQILHNATRASLVILDEVGRGTSTYDGMSIAWAVVQYLHDQIGARTLFATHFHELTELAALLPRVHNVNVLVREEGEEVVFLHRVVAGAADRSYGIHVARLAGIPPPVIEQARRVLAHLEAAVGPGAEGVAAPLPGRARGARQIPLPLEVPSPVEQELLALAVETLTPLEALNRLSELRERVRAARGGPQRLREKRLQ
ncbi:MAG: DNA mismatch repair protein MutS [Armatimonadota bacterium]|nr:DNA mismatch repair protein MutS [Armatimonadota bacterium]